MVDRAGLQLLTHRQIFFMLGVFHSCASATHPLHAVSSLDRGRRRRESRWDADNAPPNGTPTSGVSRAETERSSPWFLVAGWDPLGSRARFSSITNDKTSVTQTINHS